MILPKIQKMNLKKNINIKLEECFIIKVNDLINNGIISSAGGAAFDEMLCTAFIVTSLDKQKEITILLKDINKYKHTNEYDWWFTPEIYSLYLDACAKLDKKLLEILGWEVYSNCIIKYALLDDIAYPEMSLLEYIDSKLNDINDTKIINHSLWTTYIITKGIFDTYGILENYKALRLIIQNQTKWKNIVIWTLSLYGEQLGMLLGIDILQSFDTLKLRNGTVTSQTTLTHKDSGNTLSQSDKDSGNTLSQSDKDSGNTRLLAIIDSGNTLSQSDKDSGNTLSQSDKDSGNIPQQKNTIKQLSYIYENMNINNSVIPNIINLLNGILYYNFNNNVLDYDYTIFPLKISNSLKISSEENSSSE